MQEKLKHSQFIYNPYSIIVNFNIIVGYYKTEKIIFNIKNNIFELHSRDGSNKISGAYYLHGTNLILHFVTKNRFLNVVSERISNFTKEPLKINA